MMIANTASTTSPHTAHLTLREALDVLCERGQNDHGIASFLFERGFRGPIGDANQDPVARWIASETGAAGARVDGYAVEINFPNYETISEYTPSIIAEHLDSFDAGYYPELISLTAEAA